MQIVHKIDDFLFTIFPKLIAADDSVIISTLEDYYSYGPYKPRITIKDGFVQVDIDIPSIISQKTEFDKATALCEKRKFSEAKPILERLIKQNPTISEYHRVLGQIYSEEGNQDQAMDNLIDALRMDPQNAYAIIMMGNILARHKNDIETAMKYYNEAIRQNPTDNIAINNLGTNLLQLGKWDEGLKYLEQAYKINPNYPNTNYGIALANEHKGLHNISFDYSINCLKRCGIHDKELFNHALKLAVDSAEILTKTNAGKRLFRDYKTFLEKECGIEIKEEPDNSIPTAAKLEFAENYKRDFHLIKFKPGYIAVEHLIMHELVHLGFSIEAKKENENLLFISGDENKKKFIKDNQDTIFKLKKEGYTEQSITSYINSLYEGINRQIFNTPIDIFIEDLLYKTYTELRPYQFLSLYNLIAEGITAVTDKKALQITPKEILSASRVLNLVNAFLFKDLFGFDLIAKFNAMPFELKEAGRMFEEFKDYRTNRKPGEEYELVAHWAEDLRLEKYFELINENDYRKKSDIDSFISSFEKDPLGLESDKEFKESEMDKFQKSQQQIGINMAVVMFMVDALQYFKGMPKDTIKKIAFEIALQGTMGYSPEIKDYKISSISGKVFSGYHILAYYYVSFAISTPEMLNELQLPFDEEYKMALTLNK